MYKKIIFQDLLRQYHFEGKEKVVPTYFSVLKRLFHPRFLPVLLHRIAFILNKKGFRGLAKIFSFLNFLVFGLEISLTCQIGPGLYLPHTVGTVIGASKIGSNALIYPGVVIGAKHMDLTETPHLRPVIGDNVTISSGAKILGPIFIGNNAVIAANAVVLENVEEGALMGGVPAERIR